MPSIPRTPLNPYESAALTRLVMAFCLGKGSICLYSRSYVLQIGQPNRVGDYSHYQWRRIHQFIPTAKPPRFHPLDPAIDGETADPSTTKGQWRLRLSSKWFETAYNMLYPAAHADPATGYRPFRIEAVALDLLGAEAIASLWADRGRVFKGSGQLKGQLNLSRVTFEEAELVQRWIGTLTGAHGQLDHSPRNYTAPMLFFPHDDVCALLQALRPTWMGQAECLASKFQVPPLKRIVSRQERNTASRNRRRQLAAQLEQGSPAATTAALPSSRGRRNRKVPLPSSPPTMRAVS